MKGTDAQQPPGPNTSPTHNLRLAAARHPIDIETYFRDSFFDQTNWVQDPFNMDVHFTQVDIRVVVDSLRHSPIPQGVEGTKTFRVDHNPTRVASQNNVPTVLKWGPLEEYLRTNDYVDSWVLLEKFDNGEYQLTITDTNPSTT